MVKEANLQTGRQLDLLDFNCNYVAQDQSGYESGK